jgi:hypothetical protein
MKPKGYAKAVIQRTDNTIAKKKRIKGQTTINKILHRKDRSTRTPLPQTGVRYMPRKGKQSLLHL